MKEITRLTMKKPFHPFVFRLLRKRASLRSSRFKRTTYVWHQM